ncbi:MAG: hypothetical protein HYX26_00335 [Acidobacteriales bacterium]|nr:hypothetical protein [Terriglobales bacterium]
MGMTQVVLDPRYATALSARFVVQTALKYRLAGGTEWHNGDAINMSGSGLFFYCDNVLKPEQEIEIYIPVAFAPASVFPLRIAKAYVVRTVPASAENHRDAMAIQFL